MNLFLHIFYAVHFVFWKMGLYISIVKQRQKKSPNHFGRGFFVYSSLSSFFSFVLKMYSLT